jgi:hypothetical protein
MIIWRHWIMAGEVRPGRIARTARNRLLQQVRANRYRPALAEPIIKESDAGFKYRSDEASR